jgi:hypothetical protein
MKHQFLICNAPGKCPFGDPLHLILSSGLLKCLSKHDKNSSCMIFTDVWCGKHKGVLQRVHSNVVYLYLLAYLWHIQQVFCNPHPTVTRLCLLPLLVLFNIGLDVVPPSMAICFSLPFEASILNFSGRTRRSLSLRPLQIMSENGTTVTFA